MKKAKKAEPQKVAVSSLKKLGGSDCHEFNTTLANATLQTLWLKNSSAEDKNKQIDAALSALVGINPKDEIEGMIAAQLVASHNAAMECYRRAMIGEQTFAGRSENLAQAGKLSRTHAMLVEALNRHRGKGQQKIIVERVNVAAGGQAIVGNIKHEGGGDERESRNQPQAIAHSPGVTLWSADAEREALPVAGDAERPL
jgi:hypothetical protein